MTAHDMPIAATRAAEGAAEARRSAWRCSAPRAPSAARPSTWPRRIPDRIRVVALAAGQRRRGARRAGRARSAWSTSPWPTRSAAEQARRALPGRRGRARVRTRSSSLAAAARGRRRAERARGRGRAARLDGGARRGQAARAREQGVARRRRRARHVAGRARTARARGQRALGALPVPRGRAAERVARLWITASGGPFRGLSRDAARRRHPRAGARAPALDDGTQDHDRLGHAHEQGTRGHRGAPPVRHAVRPASAWSCIRRASCTRWSSSPTGR